MGGGDKRFEVFQGAVVGMHFVIIGDVVAVVFERRGVVGHDPDAVYAQRLDMVEVLDGSAKVAVAVAGAVLVGADVEFVEYGRFVPKWIIHIL